MISLLTPTGGKTLIPRGVMNAAGVKKGIDRVAIRTLSGDIDLWTPAEAGGSLSVTCDSAEVFGYAAGDVPRTVVTEPALAVVTDAVGAVTYSWAKTVGDADWIITNPANPSTTFRYPALVGETASATFEVTVTDSVGRTDTATVNATAYNYNWSTI